MLPKKTKIICTLGPSTNIEVLRDMVKAGMNVARLNMSHGSYEEQAGRVAMVKQVREELGIPVAILLDTKGPEFRIKTFKNGKEFLERGAKFTLTHEEVEGDNARISISYPELYKHLKVGDTVLADDGNIEFRVESIEGKDVVMSVIAGGVLSNRKSLNFPGIHIDMEYMSDIDKKDIAFGIEQGVEWIALSFVRCKEDVEAVREYLKTINGSDTALISKIENQSGVDNMDSIIELSDGIMVARGDMGVEIDFEKLPSIQKHLIKNCYRAGKVVITATQMLETMINNPRPTRAEISDVANAIYDGTSATMLSGETAAGKYPVEAVRTMAKIIEETEKNVNYKKRFLNFEVEIKTIDNAISHSAVNAAFNLNAQAIITLTFSGTAAQKISRFRPIAPIISATTSQRTYFRMALNWGVIPTFAEEKTSSDELIAHATECALKTGMVKEGDLVVIVAGTPVGISGNTNTIKIQRV
ncbi:MAG: pyruvate kinase [Chitinivibrionia bacterium]|nr:pyruvate kinase [Chitinivibrionia bacterium]